MSDGVGKEGSQVMLAQGCSRVDASHQAVLLGQMGSPCLQVPAWGDSLEKYEVQQN